MRRPADTLICCELNLRERDIVNDLKRLGGFLCDASVLRAALYAYARHFDLALDTALFAIRHPQERRAVRAARTALNSRPT
jgi:hypothetical protein